MHMTVKAENGKIVIPVPEEWDGKELEVEIQTKNVSDAILESIDRVTHGKRLNTAEWKFNRDEIYDRKILR